MITGAVSEDANIIFGASIRPELQDEIVITVVATGFDSDYYRDLERKREEEEQKKREEAEKAAVEEKKEEVKESAPDVAKSFDEETKTSIWDSIKTTSDEEDDLDVPPSLRNKLRGKK